MGNLSDIAVGVPARFVGVLVVLVVGVGLIYESVGAQDPAPVNPRGPIPVVLSDFDGNTYEVLTPEEGGGIEGEGYSFSAVPGVVPSAYIVGVRMYEGGDASNVGMTHHRYTVEGSYYVVEAVDENGIAPSPVFRFRNPAVVCLPIPRGFLANIDSMAVIATDSEGSTQTVLNSDTRSEGGELRVCGFLGTVPAVLAVGLEGAPEPLPPTPVIVEVIVELPVTGGSAPSQTLSVLVLILGSLIFAVSLKFAWWLIRRGD